MTHYSVIFWDNWYARNRILLPQKKESRQMFKKENHVEVYYIYLNIREEFFPNSSSQTRRRVSGGRAQSQTHFV
jgi:hypothetical protein